MERAVDGSTPSGGRVSEIQNDNLNPIIQLITWLLLTLTALTLGFRLLTRFFIRGGAPFSREDAFILLSFVFGLGESITMIVPASGIFGVDRGDVSDDELMAGLKVGYARDLLFLLALVFAKLSVCASLFYLSPDALHRRTTAILGGVVGLWGVSSLFAIAFQCGTQGPWASTSCINQQSFIYYEGVLNILTDAALIIIPIAIISPLHMPTRTKLLIMCFYDSRALAIAATILQLSYLPRIFEENFTLRGFPYYICLQFVVFASISSACAVYFWPFLRSLQSGFLQANGSSYTSPYILAQLSASARSREQSGGGRTIDSQGRNRKDYIKITTDLSINVAKNHEPQQPGQVHSRQDIRNPTPV
ncbi:hypothetical protein GGS26DRAFT_147777 [Hypomontagnella submonticulosa]|nr:hypothetical protein GGS26DRAFT_147777 [Hypomontagnella submonticulosa]